MKTLLYRAACVGSGGQEAYGFLRFITGTQIDR